MVRALGRLISAWQFVAKRSLAHWKLLSSVVLGVVLASAIMSGTVIYFDALRELALRHELNQHTQSELNILMRGQRGPTNRGEFNRVVGVVDGEIEARVEWMVEEQTLAGKTPTLFLTPPGQEELAGTDNARTYFAFVPKLTDEITILPGGRPAQEMLLNGVGELPVIEALVPQAAAELFDVQVGDSFSAVPPWSERVEYVTVLISGIFQRNDPGSEFWRVEEALNSATGPTFRTLPFHLSERAYLDVLGETLGRMDTTYIWLLEVDTPRVNSQNSLTALSSVRTIDANLGSILTSYRQRTVLDEALSEYEQRLFFSKLPMFVVLILIGIVILYYVITLSSLAVEERRGEVALLRSRGASSTQILLVFVLEGLTIAALSVVAGPLLASTSVTMLGYTPAFSDLTGGGKLVATISQGAIIMGGVGGLLSFAALIIPAVQASRIGVTQQRQQASRPTTLPAFQRYYVDVLLLILAIFLFRQLSEQGSVVATQVFGELVVDQLLLALPGLILVASAMVLLRLFPIAMGLASRLFSAWLPAGFVMGVWQMARNPTHYARLSLLLILTAGLGIFASSFGATLERSFEERVLYETGSDIRLREVRPVTGRSPISSRTTGFFRRRAAPVPTPVEADSIVEAFERVPGVERASPFLRATGRDLTKLFSQGFEMLALDSESFMDVAWYRDDFADDPIPEMLAGLESTNVIDGVLLPADARSIGIRVKADRAHPTVRVTARVKTARERYYTYPVGRLESGQWSEMETELQVGTLLSVEADLPLTLVSIRVDESNPETTLLAGSMLIDEIWTANEAGAKTAVDKFLEVEEWEVLKVTADAVSDVLSMSRVGFNGDASTALFSWSQGPALVARGIFPGTGRSSMPVLASEDFLRQMGHRVGDEFEVSVSGHLVPVEVVGSIDLFPTITNPTARYLVGELDSLIEYANLGASFRELHPNEVWISSSTEGAERDELIERLDLIRGYTTSNIQDRNQLLAASQIDPLVEAGWRSLLFIAFGAVLILSCVGFLVHAYVSFRSRQLQFALLRTVGFSLRQLTAMVWLEQALVIGAGLALGTWMGGRLGATIMPYLGHNDFGGQVMPPFAMEVNWGALLITYAFMIFVFALITMSVIWLIRRISLQRILRLGEM